MAVNVRLFSAKLMLALVVFLQLFLLTSENAELHCKVDTVDGVCPCCQDGWRMTSRRTCNIKCPNCRYNYSNQTCHSFCEGGSFGELCHLHCSEFCSRDFNGHPICAKSDGKCHYCLQGYYGYTCRDICNEGCLGRYCFQVNGTCDKCEPRKCGALCEETCGHCVNGSCDRNGFCSCETGWCGETCKKKCPDEVKSKVSMNGSTAVDEHIGRNTSDNSSSHSPECEQADESSNYLDKMYGLVISIASMAKVEPVISVLLAVICILLTVVIKQLDSIRKQTGLDVGHRRKNNNSRYKPVNQDEIDNSDTEDIDLRADKPKKRGKRNEDENRFDSNGTRISSGLMEEAPGIGNTSSRSTVVETGRNANPTVGENAEKFDVAIDVESGLSSIHKKSVKPSANDLH